ncbi:hypothetical protein [Xenorhabdus siamensis]
MVLILQDLLRIVLLGWTSLEVEVVPGLGTPQIRPLLVLRQNADTV